MTQRMQVVVQNNIVNAALKPGNAPLKAPLVMRLVTAVPWLQGITARFVGLGVRPEHVQSPEASRLANNLNAPVAGNATAGLVLSFGQEMTKAK